VNSMEDFVPFIGEKQVFSGKSDPVAIIQD